MTDRIVQTAQVYENLVKVAEMFPVAGNKGGSYLTMFSKGGFIFGIINIIGNFGTVFVDQASRGCLFILTHSSAASLLQHLST